MPGTLYLVATPIGNLEDITHRAVRLLREVEIVACEDTRVTKTLLVAYDIHPPVLMSYFAHNELKRIPELTLALLEGKSVALVTDAGTPGISDPASRLVAAAIAAGVPVVPVPGPAAAITAIIASGLSTRRFAFEGFLPQKKGRQTLLKKLATEERTIVIYESPHRVVGTLEDLLSFFGDRNAAVCRELTKYYEEFVRGRLSEIIAILSKRPSIKGEIVIVVQGLEEN